MSLQKKRRRENKTDYKLRLKLLTSKKKRIVIRKTNKYFVIQLIESIESQDKIIAGITSAELMEKGFDKKFAGSLKSIPAGYLTGMLFAKKINNKEEYIIDLGMTRTIAKSRVFSVVKGLIDGGLKITANSKVFPPKERLEGQHLSKDVQEAFSKLKEKIK
jgi:large subunit ribosomal protein L18